MRLTKSKIDNVINEIRNEINSYLFKDSNLRKFSSSSVDQEYLSYINGKGGLYVKFLSLLIRKLDLKNIIELGNREGLSTVGIYDALSEDGLFLTIDLERDQRFCPDEMFRDSRVSFIFGDVCDLSIFDNKLPKDIDLLFLDTVHYYNQVKDEFSIYKYFLSNTALVAIDDINLNDKRKFFDEVPYPKWDLTELCHESGWGLFLYTREDGIDSSMLHISAYKAASTIWKKRYEEVRSNLFMYLRIEALKKTKEVIKTLPFLRKLLIFLNKFR